MQRLRAIELRTAEQVRARGKAVARRFISYDTAARVQDLRVALHRPAMRGAEQALVSAPGQPAHLPASQLAELDQLYPPHGSYDYEDETLLRRGATRAREIRRLPGAASARSFLEVGCSDAMVAAALAGDADLVVAADIDPHFDGRARAAGASALLTDITSAGLADGSVDFVYSFDSFEHFPDPSAALTEMTRVVRPGGHIYLRFGPLYWSPFGEHAYHALNVPYCQVLFEDEAIQSFCRSRGRPEIDFGHVNRWSLRQYRGLWARHPELSLIR